MAKRQKPPLDIEDLLPSIINDIDDAVDFIQIEFEDDFEKADRYFNGGVDLPSEEGRSRVVSTQVRDGIRNMRPSIMRVLLSNRRRIVRYIPSHVLLAPVVEQQEAYIHQLFWANDGYRVLYEAVDESLKHRMGIVKTYWEAAPTPEYSRITMLTLDEVQFVVETPDVEVLSIEQVGSDPSVGETEVEFFDVEIVQEAANGRIIMETVPYGEFFISRNARRIDDARVHGHRRSVTVAEALEMGLDYDGDWFDLDNMDPEQDEVSGQATEARGYRKEPEEDRGDPLSHQFLLTEAYVKIDLLDVGYEQLYCLHLGGTGYELIQYERVSESPFDVVCHDPKAFTVVGTSMADISIEMQDAMTSLLRGMLDNVHAANNPRIGGNPSQVNFDDLTAWDIGHPIRFKGQGTQVQVITIPSQIQGALPMLQYLEQDSQNKRGVTNAAQGLDPNAMQSTDKQAVANTIQLSQGQVELAVRNIIETGLIPIFRKLLKLSIQHLDRHRVVKMRGMALPVDQLLFDPRWTAEPAVGLGTVTDEMRTAGLQMTLQNQLMALKEFGMNNPFVSMTNIYHTLEDLCESFGLYDVSRYYRIVTPEVEAQFAQEQAKRMAEMEAAKKGQAMDPSLALLEAEKVKAGVERLKLISQARGKALELKLKAIEIDSKDDLERDKLAQTRALQSAKILGDTAIAVDEHAIQREQAAARTAPSAGLETAPSGGETVEGGSL